MSIYDRALAELIPEDLAQLLTGNAVENVRLEFNREVPSKDEMLKKLSSFANTFGGYVVIGAEAASSNGRITALPGVERVAGSNRASCSGALGLSPHLLLSRSRTLFP